MHSPTVGSYEEAVSHGRGTPVEQMLAVFDNLRDYSDPPPTSLEKGAGVAGLGDMRLAVTRSNRRRTPLLSFLSESGPLRAVHLSRHKWPGGLVN